MTVPIITLAQLLVRQHQEERNMTRTHPAERYDDVCYCSNVDIDIQKEVTTPSGRLVIVHGLASARRERERGQTCYDDIHTNIISIEVCDGAEGFEMSPDDPELPWVCGWVDENVEEWLSQR